MTQTGWQQTWVRTVTTLLTVAVMVIIFCFSMENAEESDERSGVISRVVVNVLYPDYNQMKPEQQKTIYDEVQYVVRKCAHFTEYMLLGFVLRFCLESWFGDRNGRKWQLAGFSFGGGALYACTDELHQLLIDGRSGQWKDVLVDSSGVLLGVTVATLIVLRTLRAGRNGD